MGFQWVDFPWLFALVSPPAGPLSPVKVLLERYYLSWILVAISREQLSLPWARVDHKKQRSQSGMCILTNSVLCPDPLDIFPMVLPWAVFVQNGGCSEDTKGTPTSQIVPQVERRGWFGLQQRGGVHKSEALHPISEQYLHGCFFTGASESYSELHADFNGNKETEDRANVQRYRRNVWPTNTFLRWSFKEKADTQIISLQHCNWQKMEITRVWLMSRSLTTMQTWSVQM